VNVYQRDNVVNFGPAPSRSFFCLRHGATDWNREGRFQGRTDNPINDEGIAQAFTVARRLQKHRIDRIVCSPLLRARKTAEIIAAASATPLMIDGDLVEFDYGSLEGQVIADVMRAHDLKTAEDLSSIMPADSEPWPQLTERALRSVGKWLDAYPEATILFVCHFVVMQALSAALCGKWFHNRHGTPFRFALTEAGWVVDEVF
jgi:broad specificity phosphatase PhoE